MLKIRSVPAVLALLVQGAAFITVLVFLAAVNQGVGELFETDKVVPVYVLVLMQALFAALYSDWFRMADWWRWIHLCFPLVVWAMFNAHIPSELYLIGFAVSVSLYWTTFKTQVPFFPSAPRVWREVTQLVPQATPLRLIDIGSGLGDMPMHIAKSRPSSHVEGIEIAPLPWLISVLRAKFRRSGVSFQLGDYRALNFADYDVIFAYLSPAAMLALWDKAQHEMRPGSLLISLDFDIPGVQPNRCIQAEHGSSALYVWEMA